MLCSEGNPLISVKIEWHDVFMWITQGEGVPIVSERIKTFLRINTGDIYKSGFPYIVFEWQLGGICFRIVFSCFLWVPAFPLLSNGTTSRLFCVLTLTALLTLGVGVFPLHWQICWQSWVSYNSIQFWCNLPGGSVGSTGEELRLTRLPHFRHQSQVSFVNVSPVILTDKLWIAVPTIPSFSRRACRTQRNTLTSL